MQIVPSLEAKDPTLTNAERTNVSAHNNELGIAAHGKGDFAAAVDHFALAFQLTPESEQMLANYVDTLLRLNRAKECLRLYRAVPPKTPQNAALRALEARLLAEQGDPVKARKIFVEIFNNGYFNERYYVTYVTLAAEAVAFLTRHLRSPKRLLRVSPPFRFVETWQSFTPGRGSPKRPSKCLKSCISSIQQISGPQWTWQRLMKRRATTRRRLRSIKN